MKKLVLPFLLISSLCYAQVDLNLGLKAYYPFSGNANDISGSGFHGNPQGGIQLTTDRFGNPNSAYLFDGVDDRIIVTDNGGLSTPAFSITYYVLTEISTYQNCIGKINYTTGHAATYNSGIMPGTRLSYFAAVPPSGNCFAQVPTTLDYTIFSPAAIQLNQWYCIVNTFENGTEKMYVNGVLVQQGTVPFNNATFCANTNFVIGSWWQGQTLRVKGKMDDIRFYNRALNQDEVNALCGAITVDPCYTWLKTQAVGQSVTVGDLDVSGNQVTVEANFNCTSFPISGINKWEDIVSKHSNTTDANYILRMDLAGITTTTGHYLTPPPCDNLVTNKTYHVALVYDGSILKFYRNGFLISQVAATGNLMLNNLLTTIGDYAFNSPIGTNFIGYINEVRIWNVARTQSQLRTFMNASLPNPATQAGLLGYYIFDDLANKQGNPAWNGTLNNGATINNANPNCSFVADSCANNIPPADITNIINDYTPVLSLNPCDNKITVEDATMYNVGDTVLLIQMKGAVIDSANTASFGTITDYKNAGNYEFNYVKSKVGNIIELKNKLTRQYDVPTGKVQLIRVPYYTSINVGGTLTCLPWDGSKGGVLVLNVRDTINLQADINVSGKGFRGGNDPVTNPPGFNCNENQYYYPVNPDLASEKGEGIAIISANRSYGKGALANGGGGGNSHNSGGAGGGNIGTGGFGGYQFEGSPCNTTVPFDNRGISGKSLIFSNAANKVFLGGGGGAGHTNNIEALQAKGGNGAGIVIIIADKIINNSKKIIANGNPGINCGFTYVNCHEGMGGGGAAGTILLQINTYVDNANVDTKGGNGGNMSAATLGRVGPGGGGSGGVVWLTNTALPANVLISNSGGINGVCTAYANDPWGATAGANGNNLFNLNIPIASVPFTPNIDSVRIKDSVTSCLNVDFKGLGYTNTDPINAWQWYFGDGNIANTQNTAHTYASSGTYTVKLVVTDINGCRDSVSKPVTVSSCTGISTIINTYTPVSSLNICTNELTVEDASTFNVGDTVLMIQMKGAVIDSTNTATFGTITDYKNAGNYEFNYIKSKTGNIIELKNMLTRQYDIPVGKVQLVRVPYYNNIGIIDTLTCLPWDGNKGGILVLNVMNTLTLNGNIDVSGKGFRGGLNGNNLSNSQACSQTGYAYSSTSLFGAPKGEGIAIVSNNLLNGRGALANGGGGGNDHNSGGGGGANIGVGGNGGYQFEPCTNGVFNNGGMPGKNLSYSNPLNKVYMGGGGGSGHANNIAGYHPNGGNGGGIAMILCATLTNNGFSITANGANASTCTPTLPEYCNEGMGGGGAGGSVLINANAYVNNIPVNVKGGKGADINYYNPAFPTIYKHGPGGGGSAGMLWLNSAGLPAAVSLNSQGGANGINLFYGNNPWGATVGANGSNLFDLTIPVSNTPFKPNIDSVRIKDSALICNGFDFKGLAYTNTNPISTWQWYFGDGGTANTQNTSHAYTLSGTYNVKLIVTDINGCRDSAMKDVVASPGIVADAGLDTAFCSNSPVSVVLQGSGSGTYAWTPAIYLNDSTLQNPTATISTTTRFYLTVTGASACTVVDSVTITVNPVPLVQTLIDTAICKNSVLVLTTTPGVGTYSWTPAIYVSNPTIANPMFIDTLPQTLIVTGTNLFGCFAKDTINIAVKPLPVVRTIKDTLICSTQTITLSTSGAQTYSWTPAIFLSDPNIANPVYSGNQSQTYYVTGTAANGCMAKDTVSVTVNMPMVFQAPPDKSMCDKSSVALDGYNGTSVDYLWSPGTYLSNITIINPVANPPATTSYNVLITDRTCNTDSSFTVQVVVGAKPVINAGKSNDIDCANHSATLYASGGNTYSWSPSTGLSNPNIPNPVATSTATQQYVVLVTNSSGCSNKDSVTVFSNLTASLARYMPNAFTPNGDGKNDCYGLKNWMHIQKLQLFIFNRYGEMVFATANPSRCWDGTFKGKQALAGTYVFYIKAQTDCGTEEQKGNFLLIR